MACIAVSCWCLRTVKGLTRLLLGLIKAAIPPSLEDSKQQEATQPGSPHNYQDGGNNLAGKVILGIREGADRERCKGGAAKRIIQLICLQGG